MPSPKKTNPARRAHSLLTKLSQARGNEKIRGALASAFDMEANDDLALRRGLITLDQLLDDAESRLRSHRGRGS